MNRQLVTKDPIQVRWGWGMHVALVPKGTPVLEATNLPDPDVYWVQPWAGMTMGEISWVHCYGILISSSEIEEIG